MSGAGRPFVCVRVRVCVRFLVVGEQERKLREQEVLNDQIIATLPAISEVRAHPPTPTHAHSALRVAGPARETKARRRILAAESEKTPASLPPRSLAAAGGLWVRAL